jgi:hypothetical protein
MKNLIAIALVLFTSFSAFANLDYLVNAEKNKVMVVNFKQTTGKSVTVSIVNGEGQAVFTEEVKTVNTFKKYNLSKLSTGTYTVIITDVDKISFQKVYLSNTSLIIDAKLDVINKPTVGKSANKWMINNINTTHVGNLAIVDADGNKIYNEPSTKNQVVFNTTKLPLGTYTIEYTVAKKTFTYTVAK